MDNSAFDLKHGWLLKVREGSISLEAYGSFSIDILWRIIRNLAVGEIGLVLKEGMSIEDPGTMVRVSTILIIRDGAYVIQNAGQFYEQVYDGYYFGFISLQKAEDIAKAVFAGEMDTEYLKYAADSDDAYPMPPCYT